MNSAIQIFGLFLLSQWLINQFMGATNTAKTSNASSPASIPSYDERFSRVQLVNYSAIPALVAPIWPADSLIDIKIHVSPSLAISSFQSLPQETLALEEKNFAIGDFGESRRTSGSFALPKAVQQNGTLWAHVYVGLSGETLDPLAPDYDRAKATHFSRPLNQYLPKKRMRKLKNLLDSSTGDEEEEEKDVGDPTTIESFYHPNFTISVIPDTGVQNWQSIHPDVRRNYQLEYSGARDASGTNGWYYPVVFINRFWQLRSHMMELNETVDSLPIHIELNNMKNWKFSMIAAMDENVKRTQKQAATTGQVTAGGDGSELEMLKEVLLDTNAYLLGTTFFVSVLHMIFEGLAFKNDIAHWRKKKDMVGTSVRTILANVVMQTIIFLYLLDNNEGTSWMILAGQGFGILLEAWKITKSVNVRIRQPSLDSAFSFLPYIVIFEDKHKLNETEKKTQEYDEIAFRYLYMVAVPLLAGYAAYSLVYESHKSWYSFVIETLVGSVYAYGFLMMVPSLYINYRLKSVAHMPGKAMTYKFLNTFIDDLFAFTIRMPTLHRLATLRDDVIFFIWLYQSYKYRVDYSRVNEFGQGGEDGENANGEAEVEKIRTSQGDNEQSQLGSGTPSASRSGSAQVNKSSPSGNVHRRRVVENVE